MDNVNLGSIELLLNLLVAAFLVAVACIGGWAYLDILRRDKKTEEFVATRGGALCKNEKGLRRTYVNAEGICRKCFEGDRCYPLEPPPRWTFIFGKSCKRHERDHFCAFCVAYDEDGQHRGYAGGHRDKLIASGFKEVS